MESILVTKILIFVTKISITRLEIFPYEHSILVTGIKLQRWNLAHLGNQAELSHMKSNHGEISAQ